MGDCSVDLIPNRIMGMRLSAIGIVFPEIILYLAVPMVHESVGVPVQTACSVHPINVLILHLYLHTREGKVLAPRPPETHVHSLLNISLFMVFMI